MPKRIIKRRVVREVVPAVEEVVEQNITVSRPARRVLRTPMTLAEAVGSPTVLVREKPGKKKGAKQTVRVKRAA